MARLNGARTMDMTNGPVLGKLIRYAIPLMLTSILQLLYNAADIVVVGRFAGTVALAAVGAAAPLNNLLVNLFVGLSVGTSVVVAQHYGAEEYEDVRETVHTAMLLSLISSVLCLLVGVLFHRQLLHLMGTPDNVIDLSAQYMLILFIGVPFMLIFNFSAAILRAVGDTRRPLMILSMTGLLNVGLNLFFVIQCHLSVAGVALATTISQGVATVIIVFLLMREQGCLRFEPTQMRLKKDKAMHIVRVGIPAGMQGLIFSISNSLMQSTINTFGDVTMAGNTAAGNLESFLFQTLNAFYQASITFVGQNVGAKKPERLPKIIRCCAGCVIVLGATLSTIALQFRPQLLGLYNTDPQVIEVGARRLGVLLPTYVLCGLMDVLNGVLRGMGYSLQPMLLSVFSVCGMRVLWILVIFPLLPELHLLYLSYPISWALATLLEVIFFLHCYKKLKSQYAGLDNAPAAE
ncbi:MAG: MATE family efflux transporter [Clostridia bacterium]|nr:MATE family efflux transporter [Clostridia bacterium]